MRVVDVVVVVARLLFLLLCLLLRGFRMRAVVGGDSVGLG